MNDFFPEEPQKLKSRINRYKRQLKAGDRDGAGKRYLVGPMYQLLGDNEAALDYYKWFEEVYDDDSGEPYMSLCWALALHRGEFRQAAKARLQKTMFANLFLIPHLLDEKQEKLDIWLGVNWEWQEYAEDIPRELLRLWTNEDKDWARSVYYSSEVEELRARYIEINRKLKSLDPGRERSALVMESHNLKYGKVAVEPPLKLV